MREVFSELPMVAFRRDRNLCDVLVHTKTNRVLKSNRAGCLRHACEVCRIMTTGEAITDTSGENTYSTRKEVDCSTRNVVYVISCVRCDRVVYVGETERSVRERMLEHMRDVRNGLDKPIIKHFDKEHSVCDMRISVLREMYGESRNCRILWEERWIKWLGTRVPAGCNVKVYLR